jgi:hypothetical protein
MEAAEIAKRTIVSKCKYRPIARLPQHNEAKSIAGKFIRDRQTDVATLLEQARALRDRLADDTFERDLYDHNADYLERFARIAPRLDLPDADRIAPGRSPSLILNGVKVNVALQFRLRRTTRTNKVRIGAGMLRYAKGSTLNSNVGAWQSALLFGALKETEVDLDGSEPELQLCLTIDAYSGSVHPAPSDAVRRYQNMRAACASIAERWPNIPPPTRAVL